MTDRAGPRFWTRVAVIAVTTIGGSLLRPDPAFAVPEEGIDPGPSLGLGLALLIFMGVPLGLFVVLALLVYGPSVLRRPRYRPGQREWGYRPLWIGGPADPDTALTAAVPDKVIEVRGGGAGAGW